MALSFTILDKLSIFQHARMSGLGKIFFSLFRIVCPDLVHLPEWTFDRKVFKRISANPNLNPNPNSHPNPNPNLNPNPTLTLKHKTFSGKWNNVIFRASVQIPVCLS